MLGFTRVHIFPNKPHTRTHHTVKQKHVKPSPHATHFTAATSAAPDAESYFNEDVDDLTVAADELLLVMCGGSTQVDLALARGEASGDDGAAAELITEAALLSVVRARGDSPFRGLLICGLALLLLPPEVCCWCGCCCCCCELSIS